MSQWLELFDKLHDQTVGYTSLDAYISLCMFLLRLLHFFLSVCVSFFLSFFLSLLPSRFYCCSLPFCSSSCSDVCLAFRLQLESIQSTVVDASAPRHSSFIFHLPCGRPSIFHVRQWRKMKISIWSESNQKWRTISMIHEQLINIWL